jgi:hypothetical protein
MDSASAILSFNTLFEMKPNSTQLRSAFFLVVLVAAAVSVQAQRNNKHYAVNRSYGRMQPNSFYPIYGQRVVTLPGGYTRLDYGGNPYYYAGGTYYRPSGGYFNITFPPLGMRVNILPPRYYPVYTSGNPYYYSNGVFYKPSQNTRDYEVVRAPIGAEVPSLPTDTKTMVVNGEKFYSLNGTYFKDVVKANGELWYRVVGKNGVLNTSNNDEDYPSQHYPSQTYPQQYPQRYPQEQYPQQYPKQQYPQPAPQQQQYPQQQYPQQVPQQQYPQQVPQQQYPQQQYPQQQQLPQQDNQQPVVVPQQAPQQTQQAPQVTTRETVRPVPQQEQSIPQTGGVREAVRRLPNDQQPAVRDTTKRVTTQDAEEDDDDYNYDAPNVITHENPGMGWVVDKLPENSKAVTINGKKYFVAPNNTYYQEIVDGRQIRYKVVGKQ